MLRWIIFFSVFAIMPSSVLAQECARVLELSNFSRQTIRTNDEFAQRVSSFCSSFQSRERRQGSSGVGVSVFEVFSVDLDSDSARASQLASRLCKSDGSVAASSNNYADYVNSVAPGAYAAYTQCIAMGDDGVNFRSDISRRLSQYYSIDVHYDPDNDFEPAAKVHYDVPPSVTCTWSGQRRANRVVRIPRNGQRTLSCSRTNINNAAFIGVVRGDGEERITLPWGTYNTDGIPTDTIASLRLDISELESELQLTRLALSNHRTETGAFRTVRRGRCRGGQVTYTKSVTFREPFEETPKVLITLNGISQFLPGTPPFRSVRGMAITTTSVSREGFTYRTQRGCWDNWTGEFTAGWIATSH